MASIETTEFLGLPLPLSANKLKDDVSRIRDALIALDALGWKAYQTQYNRLGSFGQTLTIISDRQTVKGADGLWYRYTGTLPYTVPVGALPTDPKWEVVEDYASLTKLAGLLGLDLRQTHKTVTEATLPTYLNKVMAPVIISNDQPLKEGFGEARFMTPARVTLPNTGTRWRIIVDHAVDVATQDCIVTSSVAFVTPDGETDSVQFKETGREWIFDFVAGKWRVS